MGVNPVSEGLTIITKNSNPDVIIIGGDLAYDDNMCTCYFTWDFLM